MLGVDTPATMTGANISSTSYAKNTRKLIQLITSLRALGAQADFNLPRIAVIGNQSVGKSSLVEAISGITVPRANGTCTRCPMECRLTHSDGPWQCRVLLRREVDEAGKKITKEDPFGPVLHDKTELEEMLRRAQLAILNPSIPPGRFVDFDTKSLKPGAKPFDSQKQLSFSNDVVCIDLQGPDVTDLSFIDLPGIIASVAEGEDEGNITAVESMVKQHIKGNTLILLAISMRDDIDNQGAVTLAREADKQGLRTIGVLTKPDTLQPGEEDAWLAILEGARNKLKYGYYVTKQPSLQELRDKVTSDDARAREIEFFETHGPWCSKAHLKGRMGTPNLTAELSRLLGNVINQALPGLRQESKDSNNEVTQLLAGLPPPPSENPAAELLRLITAFTAEVDHVIEGREAHKYLLQACRPAYKTFQRDIRRTAPRMRPFINADGDDQKEADVGEPTPVWGTNEPHALPMYLPEVRSHIEGSLTRELPYNVPFRAKISLIELFVADWFNYCENCFSVVDAATTKALQQLVTKHFGQYTSALADHVLTIVERLMENCRADTTERIKWLLELENPPFTVNDHYFSVYRDKYLAHYKASRQPATDTDSEHIRNALASLNLAGFKVKSEDLPRLHGDDAYEQELMVMAETSAYFHVAYKRIIDDVPRVIDHDFLRMIGKKIQGVLIEGLSLGTEHATERASSYLAEDGEVTMQRVFLKQKKERLDGVLKKLFEFGL